ncbi:DNA sulfur modification protein DndB [Brevibacillus fulvus]|uniref:Uncharacterized protein n=1 Tax=Brevibacillus fulvus TaxID=1125967 RepID=A0A939BR50_9BACL|nr:DNA sulfur modification protein DndB [Brevibacillus fulvus]MBM7589098.1 hypothetical protein [Brevibacillus fulvus]
MPKVERAILETTIGEHLAAFKKNKRWTSKFRKELSRYGISTADTQEILSGKKSLQTLSLEVLCIMTTTLFELSNHTTVHPEALFTKQELKNSRTFERQKVAKLSFPYTFQNVIYVKDGNYTTTITAQEIKRLWESNLLVYNFEVQREARIEKNKEDQIVYKPKTIPKSVNEIAQLLLSGELETTMLTFNARANTADSGEEAVYDHQHKTLTITKGTQLDILDGYHRISGIIQALSTDESIHAVFDLKILNYSTRRAVQYFNQINTTNPVSASRLQETNTGNLAAVAAEELKDKCEYLLGKVASGDKLSAAAEQLVSAKVLIESIDAHFRPADRLQAKEVGKYLAEFFTELFEQHPDGFIRNINEVRKTSLINANYMFDGYICLAKRMRDKQIPVEQAGSILKQINFERTSEMWRELGVLDDNKAITANPKGKIRHLFHTLDLCEVKANV